MDRQRWIFTLNESIYQYWSFFHFFLSQPHVLQRTFINQLQCPKPSLRLPREAIKMVRLLDYLLNFPHCESDDPSPFVLVIKAQPLPRKRRNNDGTSHSSNLPFHLSCSWSHHRRLSVPQGPPLPQLKKNRTKIELRAQSSACEKK